MSGPNDWITGPRLGYPPKLRLFCVPHAGGGASLFRGWSAALPEGVEVCPVQLPGREMRFGEPAHPRLSSLLPALREGIRPMLDVPFAFFGYSMGTLIAFELARALRRTDGPQPVHLFLAAHRGPRVASREPPMLQLSDGPFVHALGRLNGLPVEITQDPEALSFFLPLLRADISLCETYQYQSEPPLPCAFNMYGGLRDPDVTRADLDAWAIESTEACTTRFFDGDHFFVRQCRTELLAALHADLVRVLERVA